MSEVALQQTDVTNITEGSTTPKKSTIPSETDSFKIGTPVSPKTLELSAFGHPDGRDIITQESSTSTTSSKRKTVSGEGVEGELFESNNVGMPPLTDSANGRAAQSLSSMRVKSPKSSSAANSSEVIICKGPDTIVPKSRGNSSQERKYICNGHLIHRVTFWRHRKHGCPVHGFGEKGEVAVSHAVKRSVKRNKKKKSTTGVEEYGVGHSAFMDDKMMRQHLMGPSHGISPLSFGGDFQRMGDHMRCVPPGTGPHQQQHTFQQQQQMHPHLHQQQQAGSDQGLFPSGFSNIPQVFAPIEFNGQHSQSSSSSPFNLQPPSFIQPSSSSPSPTRNDSSAFSAKLYQAGPLAPNSQHRFVHSMEGPFVHPPQQQQHTSSGGNNLSNQQHFSYPYQTFPTFQSNNPPLAEENK